MRNLNKNEKWVLMEKNVVEADFLEKIFKLGFRGFVECDSDGSIGEKS